MKYSLEYKLQCVEDYKSGKQIKVPDVFNGGIRSFSRNVRLWVRLYDLHGVDGLKHNQFNKDWTKEDRFELVARVIAGESYSSVSIESGINAGQLYQWVRKYKNEGYDGLELRKQGRPCKEPEPMKNTIEDNNLTPSEKEELKLLKKRIEYLEAENAYLKKVKALEMTKKAQIVKKNPNRQK